MNAWLFFNHVVFNYNLDELLATCEYQAKRAWRSNDPDRLYHWEQRAGEVQRLMNR